MPVLPTTPFLLLALYLFSKSSDKWHNWLLNHKIWGKYLQDFIATRAISKKVKIVSITTLWVTILISAICFVEIILVKILLLFIAVAVSVHILSFKTK
ncbi:MAG: YbaN family protein [Lentimicrobiaceae bacterium]|nr:YbaN family protein [Lentimicrobiaceae bacterium]